MIEQDPTKAGTRIRIMHGGPFHELMSWLGLRGRARRALVFACLCWLIPLLLLLWKQGGSGAVLFLDDWGAWAKFMFAPVLLTFAEKPIGRALDECSSFLFRVPLVASQSIPKARRALSEARSSALRTMPELHCLGIALLASGLNAANMLSSSAPEWAVANGGWSFIGLWCVGISNTLYWFLLIRLIWKHVLWWRFLWALARCDLRLVVTHPDGHGGLGFLGAYPAGYMLFTIAVSSVAAAGVGHAMQREAVTPGLVTAVCGVWLLIVALYYAAPLAAIAAQVSRLKRRTILLALAKVTDFERAAERSIIADNVFADEAEPDLGDLHDAKALYVAALKTSGLLVNKSKALPVLVPALLPMMVVGASYLPYSQLGPIAKRLLLL